MMRPNRVRGEVGLEVGGTAIVLKPVFSAMAGIEERLKIGIGGLYGRLMTQGAEMRATAAILEEAGGLPAATAERLIEDHGLVPFVEPIKQFLRNACSGGISAEEAAAAEKKADAPEGPASPG